MSRGALTDETLMRRFRDSFDEAAFDAVVRRYHRAAFVLACTLLGNEATPKDAVQEAFVRLVRQRRKYDPTRPFKPWFFQLLRNICLDAQRKHQRHTRKLREFADTATAARTPQRGRELLDLLHVLSPADRELLTLRLVQGLSFREIADYFGCSEDAAKKRGQRAISRLRQAEKQADSPPLPEKADLPRGARAIAPRTRRDRTGALGSRAPPSAPLPDFAG